MAGRVQGKVALVTGAARGQGRSHALRLASEGADIIAVDVLEDIASNHYPLSRQKDLDDTVRQIEALDRRALAYKADVRDRSAMIGVVNQAVAELGHLDIVVAQAGIAPLGSDVGPEGFIDAIQVNLVGEINAVEAALPHLKAGASIVCTGSVAALVVGGTDGPNTGPGSVGYSFSKRQVARFVHDLAGVLAPHSIRVNAVHPTNVNTDMLQSEPMYKIFRPDLENPTAQDAIPAFSTMQKLPIPWVEAIDISNAVLFLASDEARFVTGQQFAVDAGALLDTVKAGAPD